MDASHHHSVDAHERTVASEPRSVRSATNLEQIPRTLPLQVISHGFGMFALLIVYRFAAVHYCAVKGRHKLSAKRGPSYASPGYLAMVECHSTLHLSVQPLSISSQRARGRIWCSEQLFYLQNNAGLCEGGQSMVQTREDVRYIELYKAPKEDDLTVGL